MNKIILLVAALFISWGYFTGCSGIDEIEYASSNSSSTSDDDDDATNTDYTVANEEDHEAEEDYIWSEDEVIKITLNGTTFEIDGDSTGLTIENSTLTIAQAGNYEFTGSLSNGEIILNNSTDKNTTRLILNGVDINNNTSSAVYIENSKKTIVVLKSGSENYLSDGSSYVFATADDDEPNATLFSKDDLTIYGEGNLTINANYNDAIASKDGLIIKSGNLTINSVDDGIRGKDYLVIRGGTTTVIADGDGLKSNNDDDSAKGYIAIEQGTVNITAEKDGIQAATDAIIYDGTINVTTGGGSSYTVGTDETAKAIKASVQVLISGGTLTLNSADDAIHSGLIANISGGNIEISTGDDGAHADSVLTIDGGTVNISKSYEGLEAPAIYLNAGTYHVKASDDGINAADGTTTDNPNGRWKSATTTSTPYLEINGGYFYVNASGDGLDANGSAAMTGGTVLVDGPTNSGNGPTDYDGTFKISGGTLIAVGSSGMVQSMSSSSSQYNLLVKFSSSKSASTLIHLETSTGQTIFTYSPSKTYQAVIFSCPDLAKGSSYTLYSNGSANGDKTDGLYSNETYTAGTSVKTFTISNIVTTIN